MELRKVVFPEPTLPITLTNWPRYMLNLGIYRSDPPTSEVEEDEDGSKDGSTEDL